MVTYYHARSCSSHVLQPRALNVYFHPGHAPEVILCNCTCANLDPTTPRTAGNF